MIQTLLFPRLASRTINIALIAIDGLIRRGGEQIRSFAPSFTKCIVTLGEWGGGGGRGGGGGGGGGRAEGAQKQGLHETRISDRDLKLRQFFGVSSSFFFFFFLKRDRPTISLSLSF